MSRNAWQGSKRVYICLGLPEIEGGQVGQGNKFLSYIPTYLCNRSATIKSRNLVLFFERYEMSTNVKEGGSLHISIGIHT